MNEFTNKTFQSEIESVSEFLERFKVQNFKLINESKNDQTKAMLLANALPVDVLTDIQRRLKPKKLSQATYDEIEQHLTSLHSTKKSVIGASVAFLHRKQQPNESIENFAKKLNDLASQCSYDSGFLDRLLRDVFVSGLRNVKIMSRLIHEAETKTFHEMIEKAKILEQLQLDIADINPTAKTYETNSIQNSKQRQNSASSGQSGRSSPRSKNKQSHISANYVCYRCGASGTHAVKDCPAINSKCNKCHRSGHLSKVCRSRNKVEIDNNYDVKFNSIQCNVEEEDPAKYVAMYNVKKCDLATTCSAISSPAPFYSASTQSAVSRTYSPANLDSSQGVRQSSKVKLHCSTYNKYSMLENDALSDISEYDSCDEPELPVSKINVVSQGSKHNRPSYKKK